MSVVKLRFIGDGHFFLLMQFLLQISQIVEHAERIAIVLEMNAGR